eukprot:gnl/Carplike_NY0171/5302_a7236_267.p1 GENE.gnl/Carplike_NY0171/5302_a7236_267~~gnl/Carplike_NY0171/5302_a7236_267.p1  ORF type:complete len:189 (+),score=0.02 gnl/Carplike_NY0171/5302_a7236_267:40-606(+)
MRFKQVLKEVYHLSDADTNFTLQRFENKIYPAKHYFTIQGKICEHLGVVKSGLFRSFITDEKGNDITTHFFLPGTVVISADSFNRQIPAQENIVALEDSEVLEISAKKMQELYDAIPAWQQICHGVSEMKNKNLSSRSLQFQTLTARERYKKFYADFPDIVHKVALKHIASYIGIDIATLSRIRNNKR